MHRIDTATKDPDLHGVGKDGFRDGQTLGQPPTDLNAAMFNALQEESAGPIEAAGYTLDSSDKYQMRRALVMGEVRGGLSSVNNVNDSGVSSALYAVCEGYGSNVQAVAVGENGAICRLLDTGAWTSDTISTTDDFYGVLNCGSTIGMLAFGEDDLVRRSTTVGVWADPVFSTGAQFFDGAWDGANTVVIAGASAEGAQEIMVYVEGSGWTNEASNSSLSANIYGMAYGAGLFVAATKAGIMTSTDGTAWTTRHSSNEWYGMQWVESLGVFIAGGNLTWAWSTDGITWTTFGTVDLSPGWSAFSTGTRFYAHFGGAAVLPTSAADRTHQHHPMRAGLAAETMQSGQLSRWNAVAYDASRRLMMCCGDGGAIGFTSLMFEG